jgi:hypothetical protein
MPRVQVHMISTSRAPNTSGIHAPCGIFSRLEEMKVRSIATSGTSTARVADQRHFHMKRTITKASRVSTSIEPVTAMP